MTLLDGQVAISKVFRLVLPIGIGVHRVFLHFLGRLLGKLFNQTVGIEGSSFLGIRSMKGGTLALPLGFSRN